MLLKDTKTHAARRIALSDGSMSLLEEHRRRRCSERAQACGASLALDAYVFSFDPAGRQPMNPDSVTHRFGRLARSRAGSGTPAVARPPSRCTPTSRPPPTGEPPNSSNRP
ncbi:MAG TPA: hypothetical protein VG276_31250 [Actinomycetes bacterium]|nr:hypothetical protein [Actinomycetes bacterium]